MERYEFRDGSSQKFWEVGVEANTLTVRFGKIGTNGQVKTKTLASIEAAEKERATLIKEKTGKGYVLCGQEPISTVTPQSVTMSPEALLLATNGVVGGLFPVGGTEAAVFLECLKHMHAPGLYLTSKAGLQTLNRLGGLPSLPADLDWPLHLRTKRPLHFLAQVDLGALPPLGAERSGKPAGPGLPSSGMLFFFVDMGGDFGNGKEGTRVLYAPAPGAERATPSGLPNIGHDKGSLTGEHALNVTTFEPRTLQPFAVDTFYDVEDLDVDDLEIDFDEDDGGVKASAKALAKWAGGQAKDYARLLKGADIEEFWEGFNMGDMAAENLNDAGRAQWSKSLQDQLESSADKDGDRGAFGMLGAPIGGFHNAIEARQKGYVALLGVHGHMLTPSYYDDGAFLFCIKPDDLAAMRFDRAWATSDHS